MKQTIEQRLWKFIEPEPNSGCWLWVGASDKNGYGRVSIKSRAVWAHRATYEHYIKPIPPTMVLDHRCRQPSCVNPSHLRIVTRKQNALENSESLAAKEAQQTHCLHGHPFDVQNTYIVHRARGIKRVCRTCDLSRSATYYARKHKNGI